MGFVTSAAKINHPSTGASIGTKTALRLNIVGEGVIAATGVRIGENAGAKVRANSRTESRKDVGIVDGDNVDSEGGEDEDAFLFNMEIVTDVDEEIEEIKTSEVAFDGQILVGDDFIVEDEIKENKGKLRGMRVNIWTHLSQGSMGTDLGMKITNSSKRR
ncbi:hypothetical protein GOBAR_DD17999 [Gossypium barbadense]|nr:hypothetical protein GOBAR_DD17999 [Gossypium barbadense]